MGWEDAANRADDGVPDNQPSILAPADQRAAERRKGQRFDAVGMTFESKAGLVLLWIPQFHGAIPAGAGECAVGRIGEARIVA